MHYLIKTFTVILSTSIATAQVHEVHWNANTIHTSANEIDNNWLDFQISGTAQVGATLVEVVGKGVTAASAGGIDYPLVSSFNDSALMWHAGTSTTRIPDIEFLFNYEIITPGYQFATVGVLAPTYWRGDAENGYPTALAYYSDLDEINHVYFDYSDGSENLVLFQNNELAYYPPSEDTMGPYAIGYTGVVSEGYSQIDYIFHQKSSNGNCYNYTGIMAASIIESRVVPETSSACLSLLSAFALLRRKRK